MIEIYARQSDLSDPGTYSFLLTDLPDEIAELCQIVQGLFLHLADAPKFNYQIPIDRYQELNLRASEDILALMHSYDQRPLTQSRVLEARVLGICRDYALLLCSILRQQSLPARLRAGFANFILPDLYLDGVACECWDASLARWRFIDVRSQAFILMQYGIKLNFELTDIPRGAFLPAAEAWQLCRQGRLNPNRFGNLNHRGLWLIRNRMLQDLAMLNKREVLLWDTWGLMLVQTGDYTHLDETQLDLLDQLSMLLLTYEYDWDKLNGIYAQFGFRDKLTVYPPHFNAFTEILSLSC